jgi:hypothetical protein
VVAAGAAVVVVVAAVAAVSAAALVSAAVVLGAAVVSEERALPRHPAVVRGHDDAWGKYGPNAWRPDGHSADD